MGKTRGRILPFVVSVATVGMIDEPQASTSEVARTRGVDPDWMASHVSIVVIP
jgi:hypothetical protein